MSNLFSEQTDNAPSGIQLDPLSRRNFMKWSGGCAALSSTAILSQLLNLQLTQSAMADEGAGDYKALVCVFLLGGVDTFNVVAPHTQAEYDIYEGIRSSSLAIPREDLLPISEDTANAGNNRTFGIHPGMPELQALYNAGNAAVVANVGSLVFPTTTANYDTVKLPLGLFSHSDLIQHWQTSVPQSRSQVTGWGGRMADLLTSTTNNNLNISMNMALGSLNVFQTGSNVVPYVVNSNGGATLLSGYTSNNNQDKIYRRLTNEMYPSSADSELGQIYSDLLQRSLAKTKRVSIDAAQEFNAATSSEPTTAFPDTSLGDQLKMVAKTIAGRSSLNQGRQIFFVSAGGWDHHADLVPSQAGMLPMVSQALDAFYKETVELGVADCVTTFTASDFARTLSPNLNNGSDHAWGGNHFVIGGAVQGGKVYGDYPDNLALGSAQDVGRGRLIPTTSVDEYNAELAMWFGIANNTTLEDILPNIRNFYSSGASTGPVGFLSST